MRVCKHNAVWMRWVAALCGCLPAAEFVRRSFPSVTCLLLLLNELTSSPPDDTDKQAKELVEGAPKVIKKEVKKEEAEKLVAKLKEVGAVVELV